MDAPVLLRGCRDLLQSHDALLFRFFRAAVPVCAGARTVWFFQNPDAAFVLEDMSTGAFLNLTASTQGAQLRLAIPAALEQVLRAVRSVSRTAR